MQTDRRIEVDLPFLIEYAPIPAAHNSDSSPEFHPPSPLAYD
ncbi:MAG TPA: hypothetical protein VG675_10025 [Bryobacteraceae bacterium]|nr:hypothetical protein [Bryobacteraceae bacterium]